MKTIEATNHMAYFLRVLMHKNMEQYGSQADYRLYL